MHALDVDTLALWRLDESAVRPVSYADETSSYPLTPSDIPLSFVTGRYGIARFNRGNASAGCAGDATARAAGLGDWTVEFFVQPFKQADYRSVVLSLSKDGAPGDTGYVLIGVELTNNDFLGSSGNVDTTFPMFEGTIIRRVHCFWTNDGEGAECLTPYGIGVPVDGNWHHVAVRKSNSGTQVDIFIDGALKSTFLGLTNASGGAAADWRLFDYESVIIPNYPFYGMLDDIRVSKVARTDGEIYTDAAPRELNSFVIASWGGGPPPPPGPTPPVVGSFSPAVGSGITATTQLEFSVTDTSGDFTRIILVADFHMLGIREIIHDGYNFGPSYRGPHNLRTNITNGYRFTVLRTGGWPESPTIMPFAIDGGAENV